MQEEKVEKSVIQEKMEAKMKQVQDLCASLQVSIAAKLVMNEDGLRPVVVISDNEKYEEESKDSEVVAEEEAAA